MKKQERSARFVFLLCFFLFGTVASNAQGDDIYCIPEVISENLYIKQFIFNTIDNPSGNNGYTFYPIYTTVEPGLNYQFGLSFPAGLGLKYYAIYADFDGDGTFTGTNEQLINASTTFDDVFSTVAIPPGIPDIDTRLRVITSDQPIPLPCMMITNGEVEDYQLLVAKSVDEDFVVVNTSRGSTVDELPCDELSFSVERHSCPSFPMQPQQGYLVCYLDHVSPSGIITTVASGISTSILSIQNTQLFTIRVNNLFARALPLINNDQYIVRVYQNYFSTDHDCTGGYDGVAVAFLAQDGCISFLEDYGIQWGEPIDRSAAEGEGTKAPKVGYKDGKTIPQNEFELEVMPNPFKGDLQIKYNLQKPGRVNLYLTDPAGKKVWQDYSQKILDAGPQFQTINTDHLSAGMYYLVVEGQGHRQIRRLVKSH